MKLNDGVNTKASMLLSVITTERIKKGKILTRQHGIALDCEEWNGKLSTSSDFEFEITDGSAAVSIPITVPSKFQWTGSNSAIMPQYR